MDVCWPKTLGNLILSGSERKTLREISTRRKKKRERECVSNVFGIVPGNFTLLWSREILSLIKPSPRSLFVFIHRVNTGDMVVRGAFIRE